MNSPKSKLIDCVSSFIDRHGLVLAHETLVLGVSGGADSVCLFHLLVTLKDRLNIGIHVAHLNHMLRGTESDADAQYVFELAENLGVAATIETRKVKEYQAKNRLSLEEAARQVRYRFFAEVAAKIGATRIAVGHTADDQVETLLMRLVRGTGTYGLKGMRPLTEWVLSDGRRFVIIRPLLEVGREEVEIYCRQHSLAPREDSSNLSHSHLRNRIRHELVPLLQSYNPRINEALIRVSDASTSESTFFEQQVSMIWDKVVSAEEGAIVLEAKEVRFLHPALQRYLLREVVRRVLGNLEDIEWKHIEKMRESFNLPRGKRVVLPRSLVFQVEDGVYKVTAD